MSGADVYAAVTSCGIPCRRSDWGDEKPPKLPWAVYTCEDVPFSADGHVCKVKHYWTVELYEERRSKKLESKLGAAIDAAFGPYTRRESWVESQKCLLVAYDFAEIDEVDYDLGEEGSNDH